MTPEKRHKYIVERVRYWREVLEIPKGIKINIKYQSNNDPQNIDYAEIDLSMYEYGSVTLKVYDEVFQSQEFERVADETVFHELMHLFLHPLMSYCTSMFSPDEGKKAHLENLEEILVGTLERNIPRIAKR